MRGIHLVVHDVDQFRDDQREDVVLYVQGRQRGVVPFAKEFFDEDFHAPIVLCGEEEEGFTGILRIEGVDEEVGDDGR